MILDYATVWTIRFFSQGSVSPVISFISLFKILWCWPSGMGYPPNILIWHKPLFPAVFALLDSPSLPSSLLYPQCLLVPEMYHVIYSFQIFVQFHLLVMPFTAPPQSFYQVHPPQSAGCNIDLASSLVPAHSQINCPWPNSQLDPKNSRGYRDTRSIFYDIVVCLV